MAPQNADKTREVTAVRNVVEQYIGLLREQWTKLQKPISIWNIPKLYKVLQILCAVRNIFFNNIRVDNKFTKLWAHEFIRRRSVPRKLNHLKNLHIKFGKNFCRLGKGEKMLKSWVKYFTDRWLPILSEDSLTTLLLGIMFIKCWYFY